jgi:hypothetical protein
MLQASQNSTSSRNNLNLVITTETAKNKFKSAFFFKLVDKKTWPLEPPTLSSCDFYQCPGRKKRIGIRVKTCYRFSAYSLSFHVKIE